MEIKKLIKNKKIIFLSLILFLCLGVLGITSSAFAAISHCDGNDAVYDDTGERVNCGGAGDCVDDGNIVIWCTNAPACSPGDCSGQVNLCACGSSLAMAGPAYCCASVNTIYANQASCLADCSCTRADATIESVTPNSCSVDDDSGDECSYTVTVENNDTAGCAAATFDLKVNGLNGVKVNINGGPFQSPDRTESIGNINAGATKTIIVSAKESAKPAGSYTLTIETKSRQGPTAGWQDSENVTFTLSSGSTTTTTTTPGSTTTTTTPGSTTTTTPGSTTTTAPGPATTVPSGPVWPVTFSNPINATTFEELIVSIINWLLAIIGSIVLLFIIIGGIMYMTAAGNEEQIKRAKRILFYTILGFAVILISYSLIQEIKKILGI